MSSTESETDDDQYKPPSKYNVKSSQQKKSRSSKRLRDIRKRNVEETSSDDDIKPKSKPKLKLKLKPRKWSKREEKLFREGLELYGRDWKSLSKHVGNGRNPQSIRSHSQRHFLYLLKSGKSLPNKVKESGIGYTLSGNALNKYSTTVRKVFDSPHSVPNVDGVISDEESAKKARHRKSHTNKNKNAKQRAKRKVNDNRNHNNKENVEPPQKKRKLNAKKEREYICIISDDDEIHIKQQNDVNNDDLYKYWNYGDIVNWIKQIENGRFKRYSEYLLDIFEKQEVCGSDLKDIEEKHLESWGIIKFSDRVALFKHIRNLITK